MASALAAVSGSSIPNTVARVSRSQSPVGVSAKRCTLSASTFHTARSSASSAKPRRSSDALRVEHPDDVVVAGDEEPARAVEPRRGIREKPDVDVTVRADDRELGHAAVEVEAEPGGFDVPVDQNFPNCS